MLEYFTFGHEIAQSLFDDDLNAATDLDGEVKLMFAGVGDARNLYATLATVASYEFEARSKRVFVFTINDIKPNALARNLVIWLMLDNVLNNPRQAVRYLNAIFYAWCAPLMPNES